MKIILAGHNIDREIIREWRTIIEKFHDYMNPDLLPDVPKPTEEELRSWCRYILNKDNITPETISAAYARISRDPRPVNLLREEAARWISKARRSNRKIVFDMGHASIAEHAVFNIDIINISRLTTELIQRHRLLSFTEKSQRYIHLGEDFHIPAEIENSDLNVSFESFVKRQFERYEQAVEILANEGGMESHQAGEDARYLLPLCVTTQMGMTANARNIEYLLQCAASSNVIEFREFGEKLYKTIDRIAPSLVRYTKAVDSFRAQEEYLNSFSISSISSGNLDTEKASDTSDSVYLIDVTSHADDRVMAALLTRKHSLPYQKLFTEIHHLPENKKLDFFKSIHRELQPWDPVPREFEMASAVFEVTISAAAYGQLKRHRMTTQNASPYNPELGVTVPPTFKNTSATTLLAQSVQDANTLYANLMVVGKPVAPYALLGAHRRKVVIGINGRELVHLARLRIDEHAQWDIRDISTQIIDLSRKHMPLTLLMATGKHEFENRYQNLFNLNSD